ncbi:MAG: VWA domain-containing protein [Proteobacteria bacterium]|nr:VWA domain-containing protein [Pseudomonadota bacterium]MBU1688135.1 VWA domain-containing protein [Pseudomonadota bacterium]
MTFANPWALLLLLVIPVLVWSHWRTRLRPSVLFSSVSLAGGIKPGWRQRLSHLPLLLRVIMLISLVICLARPQLGLEKVYDLNQGIAIEMVVDRSGSMGEEMNFGGRDLTRLEVVKRVFGEFVQGNGDQLTGRPSDLVGLVTFAGYADTIGPLTLAHGALASFLDRITLVKTREEDGTAIGDGLMLAAARLRTAEQELSRYGRAADRVMGRDAEAPKEDYEIKSKIIILLTDGRNNRGRNDPLAAAALAKKWGIKIYTIGVGGDQPVATGFFGLRIPQGPSVDQDLLQKLADDTGGIFRMAEDDKGLRAIYREIDQLEKSEVKSVRHMDYREYFPPFALAALILLLLEVFLNTTVLRRVP